MIVCRLIVIMAFGFWSSVQAATESSLPGSLVNPGYHAQPDWFSQSFLDIAEDVAEAAAEDKQLMLYFYQDGCPYCAKLLRDNFNDPAIARQIQADFKVIALNMWGDREVTDLQANVTTEKALARDWQVQYTPTLIMLTKTGQVALRLNGYVSPERFRLALRYAGAQAAAIPQTHIGTAANPAPLLALPAAIAHPVRLADNRRDSYRPLLVIFSQHDCADCDKLMQRLQQPILAHALTNLDIAVLNRWSNESVQIPTGEMQTAKAWADQLQIRLSPSLVLFGQQGAEVFRVETLLETFHLQAVLDYVISGAYRHQPSFQRFIQHRAETLEARGIVVELLDD